MFLLIFFSYAYFYQGGGPNQFSRLGLTAALVESQSVTIDDYHELTFDKAVRGPHFYCDKAPGLSFLAVPGYALLRPLILIRTEHGSRDWLNRALYVMTLLAVSLPVALAMASFDRRAWQEAGPAAAFWVTIALALGSPLTVYASQFVSHALCAALLWLAFAILTEPSPREWSSVRAGLLVGWSVLSEFPTALVGGLLFVYLCLQRRGWRSVAGFLLGELPALMLLIVYNLAAFGGPLESGYRYHYVQEFREAMAQGFMGITGPSREAFVHMMINPFRGLLWFWPFFLAVPLAFAVLLARRPWPGAVVLASSIVIVYLLFGCSYYYWWGGASFGPRHIGPALPFVAYLVVRGYDSVLRWLVPPLTVLSLLVALMAIATLADFPEPRADGSTPERMNPLWQIAWPRFVAGQVSVKVIDMDREGMIIWKDEPLPRNDPRFYDACNLGELLGLNGLASLLPLLVVWFGLGGYLWWRVHNSPARSASADVRARASG
jgi:hypothetical protein